MEYYTAERKKELLVFGTEWMELESIMLSEMSQAVTEKYHMISPYEWNLINQTNKHAKYNQRLCNKEQTDSDQRGGGRGVMGDNRGRAIKEHG